ncbi:aminoglycoside 3-N-acetyltransferase [Kribbella italica]|uniref:Aminoglycoside N(3)-acetyltransferase n=1 Tax=Kribbella italica TaxID=1540520 RepID=A0A7W9MXS4_9ACTN|nr:aminoglycoside 3-N-acetyltransferase [Kribbella italica]MBB5839670.1 aminoglycoside 3-N-acetyltransferase [Kribbella italica]
MDDARWITADQLATALTDIGLPTGGIVMVHSRLSAFPWIVGGVEGVMRALLTSCGPNGTITAYAGWEDNPYHLAGWPEVRQAAYRTGMPAFDPAVSEARRSFGRLPERIRTWPGAQRSAHPEMNLVAVGAQAAWLTRSSLDDDPWGPDSPLARLVEAQATILLLGAPLDSLTLVHHAERIATAEPKRWVSYEMPVTTDGGGTVWHPFSAIDTSRGAFDYAAITTGVDYIEAIARSALTAGIGRHASVFGAPCHLFPAHSLVEHATTWIDQRFGSAQTPPARP